MRKTLIVAAALGSAAAAMADQGEVNVRSMSRIGPNGDPNQVLCVRQSHISSPLNIRRICRTRADWVQLRRDQRDQVDRIQFYKPTAY
ncbi:MAG TPA: hypothetical protein VF704_03870 [Allosphingosinicella sp.]